MKILVVDDNRELVEKLTNSLRCENFIVAQAYDGISAIEYVNNNPCDFILMDIDMPLLDGISALKEINKTRNIPIILMSERVEENDVIYGYESGCIDYIRKPFFIKEIVYKLNNYLGKNIKELFDFDNIVIDCLARKVLIDNKVVEMTNKEYQLLVYLVKNLNMPCQREKLLNDIWGYGFFGDDRTIDTHIKMLRHRLGKYRNYIKTIRGFGYKFEVNNG